MSLYDSGVSLMVAVSLIAACILPVVPPVWVPTMLQPMTIAQTTTGWQLSVPFLPYVPQSAPVNISAVQTRVVWPPREQDRTEVLLLGRGAFPQYLHVEA